MKNESCYRKAKILIIDDEKSVCKLLKFIMERTKKYEVWATTSPIEGINLAKRNHPDLILLDIIMSEMDGTEVAVRLSDDPSTKDILIVFVSVLANQQEIENKKGFIGGHPFISKPLNTKILMARIESLLKETNIIPYKEGHVAANIPPIRNAFFANFKLLLKNHLFPAH
ncbi:MAG: response regulator [Candidatus Omnitrophota bacterium]